MIRLVITGSKSQISAPESLGAKGTDVEAVGIWM
jgi:hypothetical protein